jgi:5-carboxymethyl-2-hydroxymuconate isomerase
MNAALALQQAMRDALLADAALLTLLGGAHIFDEVPRGEPTLQVNFAGIETRDWSVMDQKAHEHFVTLEVSTQQRSRAQAQAICDRLEAVLDNASLVLTSHRLINLRTVFWSVARMKNEKNFGATLRFRAATEPL